MNENMDFAHISRPAEGIQIIEDVSKQPGINSVEGKLGPLLWGEESQTYFMEIPAGAFLAEHPHPFEAVIYVVSGRFIICCRGKRHMVQSGGLVSFAPHVPMGLEIPFEEPALIVVFRGQKPEMDQKAFIDRIETAEVPRLVDLSEDHPARIFASQINPDFD